ncbi:MAG: hypothetical protein ACJ73D_01300, partial [Pyrinomonadaceae bacterium]
MTTETELRDTNRGIIYLMCVIVAVTAVAADVVYDNRAALGVVLGGFLAWINFRWLDSSTRAILAEPLIATTPILAMKYVFR